jgi:hypothetical protein
MTVYGIQSQRGNLSHASRFSHLQDPTSQLRLKALATCHCSPLFVRTPSSLPLADEYLGHVADACGAEKSNRQCTPRTSESTVNIMSAGRGFQATENNLHRDKDHPEGHTGSKHIELSRTFLDLLDQVVDLRSEIVELRIDLRNDKSNYTHQQNNTSKVQSQFVDISTSLADIDSGYASRPIAPQQLQEVWGRLKTSTENARSLEERVRETEWELKKKEGRLVRKETKLYNIINKTRKEARALVPDDDSLSLGDDGSVSLSAHSGTSTETEPLAREYYDLLGETKLFRERIFNFESRHQYLVAVREEQREVGETLDPSDEEFYQEYFLERKNLIQSLSTTNAEMQKLRAQCENEGVLIEVPSPSPLDDADALDHSRRVTRRAIHYELPLGSTANRLSSGTTFIFGDIDNKARVGRWLDDVRQAIRLDPSDEDVLELSKGNLSQPDIHHFNDGISQWTEREAEDLLPFPDYGLLSATPPPQVTFSTDRGAIFQADPPRRRYSEPTFTFKMFESKYEDYLEHESSKSVR